MKKVLSFILAMALVISLVPTVALAAGETVTFDFGEVDEWTVVSTTTVKNINAPAGIAYISERSTSKVSEQTKRLMVTATRDYFTQIQGRKYDWLTPKEDNDGQLVFTANLKENPATGWYQIKFTGIDSYLASDLYIYANDTYVGKYIPDRTAVTAKVGTAETYGAVFLDPDSNGEIEFMLAVAKRGKGSATGTEGETYAYFLLKSLSLTYLGTEDDYGYTVKHTIPETIDLTADATGVEFTAYADAGDGIPRAMNGINSDKTTTNADSFKAEIVSGESVTLESAVTDGIASGKLVPVKAGTTTIELTAIIDGETYTETKTVTVTVPSENADADAEDIDNKISYIVRAKDSANNDKITVSDTAYTEIGEVGEWTVGESFTATATGSDFAYWANGSGAPVSESPSYTFKPTSNFTLEAVYAPATTAAKKVQFWNYNKVFLGEKDVTDDKVESMPSNPSLNGWSFTGWKTDANTTFDANTLITEAITRVVAQFTKNAPAFDVGEDTLAYDDPYTDTATDEKDGTAFSCWTIDGQVASYNKTLSFNVWDSVDVVAVYEGKKTAVPTVVLDKVNADEYFILYEVPTGYTAVDAGIVFGTSNKVTVDSTDGSKANVKQADVKGQFTAAPHKDAAANTVARGYVMYRDTNNNLRILYTEAK